MQICKFVSLFNDLDLGAMTSGSKVSTYRSLYAVFFACSTKSAYCMKQTLWRFGNEATGQSAFLQDTDSRLTLFGISYLFNQMLRQLFFFAVCFSAGTNQGQLLFKGGVYFIGKPVDSNDS